MKPLEKCPCTCWLALTVTKGQPYSASTTMALRQINPTFYEDKPDGHGIKGSTVG